MKNKIIGILVFLFFLAITYLIQGGVFRALAIPSQIIIVFGPAIGLTMASYRKGMDKNAILKKAKRYLILSGIIGIFINLINVIPAVTTSSKFEFSMKLTACLLAPLYGLVSSCIVDTFIDEK